MRKTLSLPSYGWGGGPSLEREWTCSMWKEVTGRAHTQTLSTSQSCEGFFSTPPLLIKGWFCPEKPTHCDFLQSSLGRALILRPLQNPCRSGWATPTSITSLDAQLCAPFLLPSPTSGSFPSFLGSLVALPSPCLVVLRRCRPSEFGGNWSMTHPTALFLSCIPMGLGSLPWLKHHQLVTEKKKGPSSLGV